MLGRDDPGSPALSARDRGFVTDLVYGTERMRRACDHLVDRFLSSDPPAEARRVLRLGAYQLAFRPDLPDYAVVASTVSAAPKRFRGLTNAVLRRVASAPVEFPDEATRLSYPDWILDRLGVDLGEVDATDADGQPAPQANPYGQPAGGGYPQAQPGFGAPQQRPLLPPPPRPPRWR